MDSLACDFKQALDSNSPGLNKQKHDQLQLLASATNNARPLAPSPPHSKIIHLNRKCRERKRVRHTVPFVMPSAAALKANDDTKLKAPLSNAKLLHTTTTTRAAAKKPSSSRLDHCRRFCKHRFKSHQSWVCLSFRFLLLASIVVNSCADIIDGLACVHNATSIHGSKGVHK